MAEKEKYRELAEKSEQDAESIKKYSIKKHGIVKPISSLYESLEKAAYYRGREGDLSKAKKNYMEAIKYGSKKSMYQIIKENEKEDRVYTSKKITPIKKVEKNKSDLGQIAKELSDGFGNIVEFMIGRRDKPFAIISIVSFLLALFFISFNFTGYVISKNQSDFHLLGICFFMCGLIFIFIYLRNKVK